MTVAQAKRPMNEKTLQISSRLERVEQQIANAGLDQNAITDSVNKLGAFFEAHSLNVSKSLEGRLTDGLRGLEDSIQTRIENVAPRVSLIEIRKAAEKVASIEEVAHPKLQEILDILACGEFPMLVGPTGCGKTHVSAQVARVLGAKFGSISCSGGVTEGKLFGRSIPNVTTGRDEYQASDWVRLFEAGPSLYLLDEFDAMDDNVLLSCNQALANDMMPLPERRDNPQAKRSVDSDGNWNHWVITTANTHGAGADRQYCGRNQLDAASLDRFIPVDMDYDETIERHLCPDEDLLSRFWDFRKAIRNERIERPVSTRWIQRAYKLRHTANWSDGQIEDKFFSGWHPDEISLVRR